MIKGVENITVIDSFVVDKNDFLKAYKIIRESGALYHDPTTVSYTPIDVYKRQVLLCPFN